MYSTAPTASAPAHSAPTSGHGLGSTKWYWCLGPPCWPAGWTAAGVSLMVCSLIHRRGLRHAGRRRRIAALRQRFRRAVVGCRLAVILGAEHGVGQRDGAHV